MDDLEGFLTGLRLVETPVGVDRLIEKLDNYIIDDNGCWRHTHATSHGYVVLRFGVNGIIHSYQAHRLSYMLFVGNVPKHMDVCHHCDVRNCINPEHLFLGTRKANTKDMLNKYRGRGRYAKQVSEENTKLVVSLHEEGYSYKDIGSMIDIHYTTVGKVLRRYNERPR